MIGTSRRGCHTPVRAGGGDGLGLGAAVPTSDSASVHMQEPNSRATRSNPTREKHLLREPRAWLHEIKHVGFRIGARKDGERARIGSRGSSSGPTP